MTERTVTHATFTIERLYDASPARVFQAHADIAAKRRWFAEGEGWEIDSFESDFTVGGFERSRFRFQGGPPITNDTVFQDIVPNERIIFAYWMTVDGVPISASLATTELKAEGSGTRLRFTEQGAYLDGHDQVKDREEGTRQLLEALAKELAAA
jgi:uncharacterized protein YndB with AHSA1/START domain